MSAIRYLLDEHIDPVIRYALQRRGPDMQIVAIGDIGAPSFGTPDPDILDWIEEHGCILVTANRRTMAVHLSEHLEAGKHVPGILVLRPHLALSEVIQELHMIWGASRAEEYRDLLMYIPLSK